MSRCRWAAVLLFFAALLDQTVHGFEATWTPADDGMLPLSKNYQDKLAGLCEKLKEGNLPPSLPRATIGVARLLLLLLLL